jgi:hypothetical protein
MVVKQDRDAPGDYGYDLAHEEIGSREARDDGTGHERGSPSPARGSAQSEEDLAYDEAHDF